MISTVFAEENGGFDIGKLTDEVNTATGARRITSIADLFNESMTGFGIVDIVFFAAGALAMAYLLYGGITLMTSAGDPKGVAAGQETVRNAIIGLVIVLGSYLIVELVSAMLGLDSFKGTFG